MEKPIGVQRKRTAGFKLPPNTICVTRGTKYGNPFKENSKVPNEWIDKLDKGDYFYFIKWSCGFVENVEDAIGLFEKYVVPTLNLTPLKGKNLACFCPLDKPCHRNVLLKLANDE